MIANYFEGQNALTKDECELLIREGKINMNDSLVYSISNSDGSSDEIINKKSRSSKTAIYENNSSDEVKKVLDKVAGIFREIAFYYFRFPLCSIESPQFVHYVEGDFFSWHTDCAPRGHEFIDRDLSASVILSSRSDYEYGGLEFAVPDSINVFNIHRIQEEQGKIIVFHSNMNHRVSSIFGKERSSLVLWGSRNYGGKNI